MECSPPALLNREMSCIWEGDALCPPPCPQQSGGGNTVLVPSAIPTDLLGLPRGTPQRWTKIERRLDAYVADRGLLRPRRPRPTSGGCEGDAPGTVVVLDAGLHNALRLGPPLPHRSTMPGSDLKRYLRALESAPAPGLALPKEEYQ